MKNNLKKYLHKLRLNRPRLAVLWEKSRGRFQSANETDVHLLSICVAKIKNHLAMEM